MYTRVSAIVALTKPDLAFLTVRLVYPVQRILHNGKQNMQMNL